MVISITVKRVQKDKVIMYLETSINGIPCVVKLEYEKACRGHRESGGRQIEPDLAAAYEIAKVFKHDGSGKHMSWLEDKLTSDDRDRINQEAKKEEERGREYVR